MIHTRREICLILGAGTAAEMLLAACGQATIADSSPGVIPPPVSLDPTPNPTATPTEKLFDERFRAAVSKGRELERQFPQEFAGASQLGNVLDRLSWSGELLTQDQITDEAIRNIVVRRLAAVFVNFDERQVVPTTGNIRLKAIVTMYVSTRLLSPQLFSPEEQVMALLHELNHHKEQQEIVKGYNGKQVPREEIRRLNREVAIKNEAIKFEAESKELFKNCQQLAAIKRQHPSFSTRLFEAPLPRNRGSTLYGIYTLVVSEGDPRKRNREHPRWKLAVENYIRFAHEL